MSSWVSHGFPRRGVDGRLSANTKLCCSFVYCDWELCWKLRMYSLSFVCEFQVLARTGQARAVKYRRCIFTPKNNTHTHPTHNLLCGSPLRALMVTDTRNSARPVRRSCLVIEAPACVPLTPPTPRGTGHWNHRSPSYQKHNSTMSL